MNDSAIVSARTNISKDRPLDYEKREAPSTYICSICNKEHHHTLPSVRLFIIRWRKDNSIVDIKDIRCFRHTLGKYSISILKCFAPAIPTPENNSYFELNDSRMTLAMVNWWGKLLPLQ